MTRSRKLAAIGMAEIVTRIILNRLKMFWKMIRSSGETRGMGNKLSSLHYNNTEETAY